ncbi:hypothetical protein EP232_04700, partial [bacterium]
MKGKTEKILLYLVIPICVIVSAGCAGSDRGYHTFADYPGFAKYYQDRCQDPHLNLPETADIELLYRFRPKIVLPPGGLYPIDFYRDYLPYTVMRSWPERKLTLPEVSPHDLMENRSNRGVYLDLDLDAYRQAGLHRRMGDEKQGISLEERAPVVYGRVYRETVSLPGKAGAAHQFDLTFLKYNLIFAISGLPAQLSPGSRALLWISGMDGEDWHELDNFVAIHIVLDEAEKPIAVVLAQHNHHRTYIVGNDLSPTPDGRFTFDIALRSNEVYPASGLSEPVTHRVVRWSLYLDYLISGEDPPRLKGYDLTYGVNAGGGEVDYDLLTLSPCDPLYTAQILLGEPRPFWGGIYLGRDGPPGSDYYNVPALLPLGNLLKFGYLQDGDEEDVALVRQAIDRKAKTMDI